MSNTYKITGSDAVRIAERDNLQLRCYANPIDEGGPISVDLGRQILKDDPSLLYIIVTPDGWWDGQRVSEMPPEYNAGDYFTSNGMYLGPDDSGVEPTWNNADKIGA